MFKKRWFQIVVLLGLIAIIPALAYIRKSRNSFETDQAQREFAVKEKDKISRIFIVDKQGKYVDLKKQKDGSWRYNDSFVAWQNRVEFLIDETIAKIEVKSTVPVSDMDNVLRRFTVAGIKVEVYSEGLKNKKKVYYVGGTTSDQLGTYFMMEGDKSPYVLHVPGFNGYLNTRYSLDRDEWISRTVFGSKREEIEKVEIDYPDAPKSSFTLIQKGDEVDVQMEPGLPTNLSEGAVKSYLNFFELLNFEGYDNSKSKAFIDSLKATKPLVKISVTSANRGLDELSIYLKPMGEKTHTLLDKDGNELTHDADRYFGIYNKLDRLLIVQDYTFSKVLVRYEDLLKRQ